MQRLVVFMGKGAEKVFWHDYRDTFPGNKFYQCNLVHPRGNVPKPAYHAFKLLVRKRGSFETVEKLPVRGAWAYRFDRHEAEPVIVAWGGSARTLDLSRHFKAEKVRVTHIVEAGQLPPKVETADARQVPISESPVFVEAEEEGGRQPQQPD